ncbi:MAG: hypothetical protein ACRDS0_31240 [Pseudonocardiaceae bacterium]
MTNPLVVEEKHETTPYAGIGIIESAYGCGQAIRNGEWVDAGIDAVSAGLEELNWVDNPAGALLGCGVDWLFEHVDALSKPLDWLAGNPDAITAHAQTWGKIADAVTATRRDYAYVVSGDLTNWRGAAADAYRRRATDTGYLLETMSVAADTIGVAITLSGQVVNAVRSKIREWIAKLVADLIAWVGELVCTAGVATPVVAEQATVTIAQVAADIAKLLIKLANTIKALMPLLHDLGEIFTELRAAVDAHAGAGSGNLPTRHSPISHALDG